MEHLPTVPDRTDQGLETVPFVCEKQYDEGPFLTYPIREGKLHIVPDSSVVLEKAVPIWQHEKLHPTPNKEFEAFCQTWLFFGLIHELLGNSCESADFVRLNENDDSRTISTSRLPGLVEQWVKSVEDGSSTMTYEHVAKCLRLTFETLWAAGPEFDLRVKLCIASVGEFIKFAANKAFGIEDEVSDNKCPNSWHKLLEDTFWVERFSRSGWCPSQVDILLRSSTSLSLQSLYFFASMHDSILAGRHRLCDYRKCVAYHTDPEDYITQHVNSDCPCKDLHVDMPSLDAVLKTGGLPLLRIREAETLDQLVVEIVDSQPDTRYLALSHVWADGLGNAKANALPRCQLLRLSKLTQSLKANLNAQEAQTELLFWCDTLCCPVTPGPGKDRVLSQMRNIYERATCVLVLDKSMVLYESKSMGLEEACARILSSGWMRRLWTLQEGALPAGRGRLWFQFRDQALHFDTLWQQIKSLFNVDLCRKNLAGIMIMRLGILTAFYHDSSKDPGADLATVDVALEHRSVSVSSDEPLLLGSMFGLDIARILDESIETRMHRMWSLMSAAARGVPKDIIFRLGPRLGEKGYRWAPSTMMYHEDTNAVLQLIQKGDNHGILTQHGLKVRLPGYQILFPQRPFWLPATPWGISLAENMFWMRDDEARWYLVARRWPNAEGDYLSTDKFSSAMRSSTNLWVTFLETRVQARTDGGQHTSTALLTRLIEETSGVKYVQSYMHIHVGPARQSINQMFEAAYGCAQKLAESAPAQQLANMSEDGIDMQSPEYKAAFEALEPEIFRVAANGENDRAMATARQLSGKDNDTYFGATVASIFIGNYAIMGAKIRNDQQWCID